MCSQCILLYVFLCASVVLNSFIQKSVGSKQVKPLLGD